MMPESDPIKEFAHKVIPHTIFTKIQNLLDDCRVNSKRTDEPLCALIEGDTRVGKTIAMQTYCANLPPEVLSEHTRIPVFYTRIPESATPMSLVGKILRSLNDPYPDTGSKTVKTSRLERLLKGCETQLIILDEFQHFIDGKRHRTMEKTADWLKVLIDETKIPIVLVGMPGSSIILDLHPQLNSRFFTRMEFPPFPWKTTLDKKAFRSLLKEMADALPYPNKPILSEEELAYRFHRATGGKIGHVKKLIVRAMLIMENQKTNALTVEHFQQAYAEKYGNGENPFLMKTAMLKSFKLPVLEDEEQIKIKITKAKPS
ncbi:MAG: TniB family NTP-binding protein [Acidobacteria bacterium]|nr:TniB family NTP-binding protein [Acidobacteriota bacterium]